MRLSGRTTLFFIVATIALSGCNDPTGAECHNLLAALRAIQPDHLSAPTEFDPAAFQYAQMNLLAEHKVKIPDSIPREPELQCIGTLGLLEKTYSKIPLREFTLELITSYTHQWDPHTDALSQLALGNVGGFAHGFGFDIERTEETGRVEISDVIAGSPADAGGLKEGMLIWTLNHRFVREISTTELRELITDQKAADLVVGVVGGMVGGQPQSYHEVTIQHGEFEASPVKLGSYRVHAIGADFAVGYIKVRAFTNAQAIFAEGVRTLKNSDALVLDLRNISGGEIRGAADLAGSLLANVQNFVGLKGRDGRVSELVQMRGAGSAWEAPLVVLVNSTTKSAAEILAGTLQDYGAIVVGSRTFGKGTRQQLVPLDQYHLTGGILLTDAFTVRPSGKIIQGKGIQPDVNLPSAGRPKYESDYAHALTAPPDQSPLSGYDPSAAPQRSPQFRQRLAQLERDLQSTMGQANSPSTQDDAELEAAKRVAAFLATQALFDPASGMPQK